MRPGYVAALVALFIATASACTGGFVSVPSLPYIGPVDDISTGTPLLEVPCDNLAPTARGKWYYISPSLFSGFDTVYFDTCTKNTTIDVIVQIFTSDMASCSPSPVCTGQPFFDDFQGCETKSFTVLSTKHYWVYVTSYNGGVGSFSINFDLAPMRRPFDTAISFGTSYYNSFTGYTYVDGSRASPPCPSLAPATIGLMYALPYTDGASATVSACPFSGSDLLLTTYRRTSSCNNEACYECGTPLDAPSGTSCEAVVVTPQVGETIYFFVSGINPSFNVSFTIGVERSFISAPTTPSAAPVTILPTCLSGFLLNLDIPTTRSISSTRTSGFSSGCASLQSSHRGDWYRLPTGLTGTVYISTCDIATTIDTQIVAFAANGNGCTTCSCMSCFNFNDNRNSTFLSLCSQSTRSVLQLDLTESTSTRPVYLFVGSKSTTATSGTYKLVASRDLFRVAEPPPVGATDTTTTSSGSAIAGVIGGTLGGFFFIVILVSIVVACAVMRRRRYAGGVTTMTMASPPQTATVMVTQQQTTTTALPMNSPAYVNSVEMQPLGSPTMMQPMMQPGMQPMQPGMQQMPPSYYT